MRFPPLTYLDPLVCGQLAYRLPRGLQRHPEEVEDGPDEDRLLLSVPNVHEAEGQEGGEELHQRAGPPHDERQVEVPALGELMSVSRIISVQDKKPWNTP